MLINFNKNGLGSHNVYFATPEFAGPGFPGLLEAPSPIISPALHAAQKKWFASSSKYDILEITFSFYKAFLFPILI